MATQDFPDVDPSTHFVGVCGVNTFEDQHGKLACDPAVDGWMLSDFYLLNHMFRGLGRSQSWFTCISPSFLVEKYGEYAHGNPYGCRKVVLDSSQGPDEGTVKVIPADRLLEEFLASFGATCRQAREREEPVLLCITGHGGDMTYGVEIGGEEEEGNPLLQIAHISHVIQENPGLQVTILLLSCFSAGWTIAEDLLDDNGERTATIVTAAGIDEESESWPTSSSQGRACGSLFMSAFVHVLMNESLDSLRDETRGATTTADFATALNEELLNKVDPRFGYLHCQKFEVQSGKWSDPSHIRTGIPIGHYHQQVAMLRTVPCREFYHAEQNRSLSREEVDAWNLMHPTTTEEEVGTSRFGTSRKSSIRTIRAQAKAYMSSRPGRDSLSQNIAAHADIWAVINDPHQVTDATWGKVYSVLENRIGMIELAKRYALQICAAPRNPNIWDRDRWLLARDPDDPMVVRVRVLRRRITELRLFPLQAKKTRTYQKPGWYLAMTCAETELPLDVLFLKLEFLKSWGATATESLRPGFAFSIPDPPPIVEPSDSPVNVDSL